MPKFAQLKIDWSLALAAPTAIDIDQLLWVYGDKCGRI